MQVCSYLLEPFPSAFSLSGLQPQLRIWTCFITFSTLECSSNCCCARAGQTHRWSISSILSERQRTQISNELLGGDNLRALEWATTGRSQKCSKAMLYRRLFQSTISIPFSPGSGLDVGKRRQIVLVGEP